jgi:4,5-dihydroxyphthalate decarboxylase
MSTVASGTAAHVAIPAFVSRIFRHSGIYIRRDASIEIPADLRGKRIGLREHQITAVVWMRGMRQHECGVASTEIHWRNGGLEESGRGERTPLNSIPGEKETLVGMLRDGELDAIFTARPRSSFLRGEPHIGRLFPDTRGPKSPTSRKPVLPIMHLIGIRKKRLAQYPWLATSVYKAFCEAKALAMIDLRDINALTVTLPFLEAETLDAMAIMENDFWRYGVHENMADIDALTPGMPTSRA